MFGLLNKLWRNCGNRPAVLRSH